MARAIGGNTGLLNCGNLLNFKIDVGRNLNLTDRYGYLDPIDVNAHGIIVDNNVAETIIYGAYSQTSQGFSILSFGVAGNEQIQLRNTITVTWQGYTGAVTYVWDGANLNYRFTDAPLAAWIASLNGQRVSFDVEYIAIMATDDGTTVLRRAIANSAEINEITTSMWIWRDSGINAGMKMYDVGDGNTSGTETTRFRFNAAAQLKSFVSNSPDAGGTWSAVASVTKTDSAVVEDVMHHIYMTAKNDVVDGVGTQVMELSFFPSSSTTFSFVAGDFVTLLARHDLIQILTGRVADIWSGGKYMDGATNVAKFRKVSPADVAWSGGYPVDLGATGIVNGVIPGNYLGGKDYSVADWNNGLNRGSNGSFTRIGGALT